jgi:hypothetical protein
MRERLTYSFGPLERRGIAGSFAAGQVTVLAGGALLAILALDHFPSAGGATLATLICVAAAAAAFVPVGGRSAQEWLPIASRFLAAKITGDASFVTTEPTAGTPAGGRPTVARRRRLPWPGRRRDSAGDAADLRMPAQLRGVRVVPTAYRDRPIGILTERSGRLATAVLACRVGSFSLLDHDAQERRLSRWGLVLSGAGGGPIRRLQWIERTAPAQGDELARWVHSERDPAIGPRGTAMIESYLELISTSTKVAQEHEVLLAVQVDARRTRERGHGPAVETLLEQTERVAQGLEAAEVTVLGALTPAQLAHTLRTAFDPYARAEMAALAAAEPDRGDAREHSAWPVGAREAWDHYASDGAVHATYWISAWPRVEVSPMFMDSLLGHSTAVRTVAVTFEPLPIDRSTREIEAAVTRDRADRELRARFGQSETARQRQAAESTRRREVEHAAGHGEVRLSGFVTVSGRDAGDLRRACSEVMEHAARARLELRRLYGQQADAFTFTVPLCRGLR